MPNVRPKSGKSSDRLLPADHAVRIVLQDQHDQVQPEPDRRFQLLAVHHEAAIAAHRQHPPVRIQHGGHHRRRQPRPHGRERVVEQQRVGDPRAIVAREPDLVHAVVKADDAVLRHHLPHVMHDPLRRLREPALLGAIGNAPEDLLPQRQQRLGVLEPAFQPVRQQREARPDIADDLGVRVIDFLHIRRQIADMDHPRPVRPHDEGRLLDRVVADADDQVGPVDRLMHVVALGQRRRAHVELGAARDRALAHLRVKERNADAAHEVAKAGRRAAAGSPPRPSITSGRSA